MKGDVIVISSCLKPWERYGMVRYYCTSRVRFTEEEREDYLQKTGTDPEDRSKGIKVYFDEEGELHIDNCHLPEYERTIESRVTAWYEHQCALFRSRFLKRIHIYDHLERYMSQTSEGTYKIEYRGVSYVCEKCDINYLRRFGEVTYDALSATYEIGPQEPELRKILSMMIDDLDPQRTGILPVPQD